MRIGIVGSRIAGSYAAILLARQGHEIVIFDRDLDREKPCGGGVTYKALRTMSWFREHRLPHTEIRALNMATVEGATASLPLRHPIHIFSRSMLDSSLRESAISEGARLVPERVVNVVAHREQWILTTNASTHQVDYLIGADGASSSVRAALAERFRATDLSLALGYYVPGVFHQDRVMTLFQEQGFRGYLWSFPRTDHTSIGILKWLPEANAKSLRQRVEDYILRHYPSVRSEAQFYAARIPCLSRDTLKRQKVCGRNWALLGDAAGFADPITAEGIHFALRSAELLATAFKAQQTNSYENLWRNDFGHDLQRAASWRDRFYVGRFLFDSFIRQAIRLTRHSPTVQHLTDQTISGSMTYARLRRKLVAHIPQILVEVLRRQCFRHPPTLPTSPPRESSYDTSR